MRPIAILVAAALASAACGGAAQPAPTSAAPTKTAAPTVAATAAPTVAATAAPTPASKVTFDLNLKPENVVPPVTNDEKVVTAKATVVFDLTRDAAGKITAAKASVDITFSNVPATTQITIGHIHGPGAAGVAAGVKVGFKTDADNPLPVSSGTASFKKADVTVDPDLATQFLEKPTDWYLQFHSKLSAAGLVRAQLKS